MIKWTFFFEEGHVSSMIKTQEEDERISSACLNKDGMLSLPGEKMDLFVDLDRVKLISREIVDDTEQANNPEAGPNPV